MLSLSPGPLRPCVAGGRGDAEDAFGLRHRELADEAPRDLAARRVLGLVRPRSRSGGSRVSPDGWAGMVVESGSEEPADGVDDSFALGGVILNVAT